MIEETRTPEEIQRSLSGTRQRIDDDLDELSRRMRTRGDSLPSWVKGAGIAAAVVLLRRPLFRLIRAVATVSAPVVIPLVIGKLMERRASYDGEGLVERYGEGGAFSERRAYGEEAFGTGYGERSYSP